MLTCIPKVTLFSPNLHKLYGLLFARLARLFLLSAVGLQDSVQSAGASYKACSTPIGLAIYSEC
ncbi:hypothetical protein HQ41_05180 [Porphyromonas sp. COT-290 OH860]|nr:hypothetical protein HQ41_05180 [Porphyromonas sp. COT-290 OH860]